jgi:hypothetical protein
VRLLDSLRGVYRDRRDQEELRSLVKLVADRGGERDTAIAATPFPALAGDLLDFEGVYSSWSCPPNPSPADLVQYTELLKHLLTLRAEGKVASALAELLGPLEPV